MLSQLKTAFAFALCLPVAAQPQDHRPHFPSRLKSMSAMLFYTNTGKFSQNILDNPNFSLWNTIIGEGSAEEPSSETLVLIEVVGDGSPDVSSSDKLTVTTQVRGMPPIKRRVGNFLFSRAGTHFEAIWLYDTGCGVTTISAQLNGEPPITKTLDFECGE